MNAHNFRHYCQFTFGWEIIGQPARRKTYKRRGGGGALGWAVRQKGSGLHIAKSEYVNKSSIFVATRTNLIHSDRLTLAEGRTITAGSESVSSKTKTPRSEQGRQPRSPEAAQPLVIYPELRGITKEGNTE